MIYEPWMLAAIDQAGYNGIRDEHVQAVAEELLRTGLTETDCQTFSAVCRRCGVEPACFMREGLDELERARMGESMFGVLVSILVSIFVFRNAFALSFCTGCCTTLQARKHPKSADIQRKTCNLNGLQVSFFW